MRWWKFSGDITVASSVTGGEDPNVLVLMFPQTVPISQWKRRCGPTAGMCDYTDLGLDEIRYHKLAAQSDATQTFSPLLTSSSLPHEESEEMASYVTPVRQTQTRSTCIAARQAIQVSECQTVKRTRCTAARQGGRVQLSGQSSNTCTGVQSSYKPLPTHLLCPFTHNLLICRNKQVLPHTLSFTNLLE